MKIDALGGLWAADKELEYDILHTFNYQSSRVFSCKIQHTLRNAYNFVYVRGSYHRRVSHQARTSRYDIPIEAMHNTLRRYEEILTSVHL